MAGKHDLWRWKFRAAVWSAPQHAKAKADMLRMLDNDYPLFAEDKAALADYIRELTRPHTKWDRGKRSAAVAYEADKFRRAVDAVKEHAKRFKLKKRTAIDDLCILWHALHMDWAKYRNRLYAKFHC